MDEASDDDLIASPHRTYADDPGIDRIERAPERHQLSCSVEGMVTAARSSPN